MKKIANDYNEFFLSKHTFFVKIYYPYYAGRCKKYATLIKIRGYLPRRFLYSVENRVF